MDKRILTRSQLPGQSLGPRRLAGTPVLDLPRSGAPFVHFAEWEGLALGHAEGPVQFCRLTAPSSSRTLRFSSRISNLAFSPDGQLLAAASFEGTVRMWEIPNWRELPELKGHRGVIHALAFSPDSRHLATAGDNEEAFKLWDMATWQKLITIERPGESLEQTDFSTKGSQLTART